MFKHSSLVREIFAKQEFWFSYRVKLFLIMWFQYTLFVIVIENYWINQGSLHVCIHICMYMCMCLHLVQIWKAVYVCSYSCLLIAENVSELEYETNNNEHKKCWQYTQKVWDSIQITVGWFQFGDASPIDSNPRLFPSDQCLIDSTSWRRSSRLD